MSKYEMRPLKTKDIYTMSKILKKLDVKITLDLNKFKGKSQEQAGQLFFIELIKNALENLHFAQNEVNTFLAELVGIEANQFDELSIEDTVEIINQFKSQKGLATFLQLAGK